MDQSNLPTILLIIVLSLVLAVFIIYLARRHALKTIEVATEPGIRVIKTLPEGVWRIINVDAPTLRENLETATSKPMVRVRHENHPDEWESFSGIRINGTCELFPTFDKPLPGTNGRGICYITTQAEIECFGD